MGDHDENITVAKAAALLGEARSTEVIAQTKRIYELAAEYAGARGILVADTKMEWGTVPGSGEDVAIVLGDECLTPDCSRYWPASEYEVGRDQASYDKQYVRDYLKSIGFDKKVDDARARDARARAHCGEARSSEVV